MTGRADRRPAWPGLHLFTATLGTRDRSARPPGATSAPASRSAHMACVILRGFARSSLVVAMDAVGGAGDSDRHRLSTASSGWSPSPCPVASQPQNLQDSERPVPRLAADAGASACQAGAVRSGSWSSAAVPTDPAPRPPSSTRRHPPPVSNAPVERVGGVFPRSRSRSMPRHTTRPPSGNSSPRPGHRAVYGRGYRRARAAAFKRSKGLCQHCGLRPAVEAHHYALKYPDDGTVTADDLTAAT